MYYGANFWKLLLGRTENILDKHVCVSDYHLYKIETSAVYRINYDIMMMRTDDS